MARKKKAKKQRKKFNQKESFLSRLTLPDEIKKWIFGLVLLLLALIIGLSFFSLAGVAGSAIMLGLTFLVGKAAFGIPLILVLGGLVFFRARYENALGPAVLGILLLIVGISGLLESFYPGVKEGGWLGYVVGFPLLGLFGGLVAKIILAGVLVAGLFIFWHLLKEPKRGLKEEREEKPSLIRQIFTPKFEVEEIEPREKEPFLKTEEVVLEPKTKGVQKPVSTVGGLDYKLPPFDLLDTEKGKPAAGDIVTNSALIKKTLENFGIGVEMSEVNIGPTVTQYTLKPAEGIKLSKITTLSNNLSLALASHPIRIEAPIPGKPLVGIEVPNKTRCQVRLRDLLASPSFQQSSSSLFLALGQDVSGRPRYADLARMPHLLVAGSTGTGKTIFLNSLILTLLYQNSPNLLRFILIDPKRVEFSAYKELPHLLAPVIFDAQKAINALRWLVSEMERRFVVLSGNGSRDIRSYNEKVLKTGEAEPLPCIVLIIDELADLMAARGREMEAGVVRLAQMARAVGIHLVVATQRPSVEVITGLIKANITSRVTFQVASQVDSRTVLDMAGAERLLGLGDMLFVSAESGKPRRIQGAYVAEKEVKRVIDFIKDQKYQIEIEQGLFENHLAQDLAKTLQGEEPTFESGFGERDDPLYEEAKRVVVESKKASASLLQRRLRIGYARAARLLDILEEQGVVGPGEGAKPREILIKREGNQEDEDEEGWQKI